MKAQSEIEAGKQEKQYNQYLAGVSRMNADLARASGESQARTVGAQTAEQVGQIHERGRDVVGAQKVALAAGGAGVGSKTAEQLVSDTLTKTNLDEMAIRYNADLKMKNLRLQAESTAMNEENKAEGYEMAGKNAKKAAKWKAFSTVLGTGSQVASKWDLLKSTPSADDKTRDYNK
jgi:hypothetical protein